MAQRIVVIGGGAAGIGAAGAAKGVDPSADVRVYTEFEDVGYSPCGIPYVQAGRYRLRAPVHGDQTDVRQRGHRHPL